MSITMNNRNHMVRLFDCYSGLLTERQKNLFEYYFYDDLSLGEIAEEMGVSRQAVHNSISRCEKLLEDYEEQLHMLRQTEEQEKIDQLLYDSISLISRSLQADDWSVKDYKELLTRLKVARKVE